jgi:hypothetical protein
MRSALSIACTASGCSTLPRPPGIAFPLAEWFTITTTSPTGLISAICRRPWKTKTIGSLPLRVCFPPPHTRRRRRFCLFLREEKVN